MRREQILEVMRRLRLEPNDHGRDWIEGFCPFGPWKHDNGISRATAFACRVEDKGASIFTCQSCGEKGAMASIPLKMARLGQVDAATWQKLQEVERVIQAYEEGAGIMALADLEMKEPDPEPQPMDEAVWCNVFLPCEENEEATTYLESRLISSATVDLLGLQFDDVEGRIQFPLRDRAGALWGFAGRSTRDAKIKVRNWDGTPRNKYILGENRWRQGLPVMLVEGLFGFAWLHEIGFHEHCNLGAILGSAMSAQHAETLSAFGEPVFLMLDNNQAGQNGIHTHALPKLEAAGVRRVHLPQWPDRLQQPDGDPGRGIAGMTLEEAIALLSTASINKAVLNLATFVA